MDKAISLFRAWQFSMILMALAIMVAGATDAAAQDVSPPRNVAEANTESAALAQIEPVARQALKEVIAWRFPYLAPGGDASKVQDYGGEYAVQVVAKAIYYRRPAMVALARRVLASPATVDPAAIRLQARQEMRQEAMAATAALKP